MKGPVFGTLCAVTMVLAVISSPSVAQMDAGTVHYTVKACLDDWRVNRVRRSPFVSIAKRDYVAWCRNGFVPAVAVTLAGAPRTAPDSGKVVTRRSLSMRQYSAAPERKDSGRSLRDPRPHSMPPAATVGTNKAVTGMPTSELEGTVDW